MTYREEIAHSLAEISIQIGDADYPHDLERLAFILQMAVAGDFHKVGQPLPDPEAAKNEALGRKFLVPLGKNGRYWKTIVDQNSPDLLQEGRYGFLPFGKAVFEDFLVQETASHMYGIDDAKYLIDHQREFLYDGLVERGITRILCPGTVLKDDEGIFRIPCLIWTGNTEGRFDGWKLSFVKKEQLSSQNFHILHS